MSIEVAIPLLLMLIILFVLTEINENHIKSLEKRIKELETNPDSNWVEARNRYNRDWPKEDR